jgi:glycosyltransferase involved in cell wall biosynthesis
MFPSSDEGFGLPVGEALYLGRTVVSSTDSGLDKVYGAHAGLLVGEPNAQALADLLCRANERIPGPRQRTTLPVWGDAVDIVRNRILSDVGRGRDRTRDER